MKKKKKSTSTQPFFPKQTELNKIISIFRNTDFNNPTARTQTLRKRISLSRRNFLHWVLTDIVTPTKLKTDLSE